MKLIILLAFALTIASCKKEDNINDNPEPSITADHSIHLRPTIVYGPTNWYVSVIADQAAPDTVSIKLLYKVAASGQEAHNPPIMVTIAKGATSGSTSTGFAVAGGTWYCWNPEIQSVSDASGIYSWN